MMWERLLTKEREPGLRVELKATHSPELLSGGFAPPSLAISAHTAQSKWRSPTLLLRRYVVMDGMYQWLRS